MKTVAPYAFAFIALAIGLGYLSFHLSLGTPTPTELFWSNLLMNIVAEIGGVGLGLLVATHLAIRITERKLKCLAPPITNLIEQLRKDNVISEKAAQAAVVVAVNLISEDSFNQARNISSGTTSTSPCRVCALVSKTIHVDGKVKCAKCGLPGTFWEPK